MKENKKKDIEIGRIVFTAMILAVVLHFAYMLVLNAIEWKLPADGVYYCERVDTTFYISRGASCLSFPNCNVVMLIPPAWNSFTGQDPDERFNSCVLARGTFYWNQKKDVLYIYFEEFPGEIGWNRLCKFERIE